MLPKGGATEEDDDAPSPPLMSWKGTGPSGLNGRKDLGRVWMSTFDDLKQELLAFRDARDWKQFHTPRQLAAALAIEASELQQAMLWKTDAEVTEALADGTLTEVDPGFRAP